MFSAQRGTFSVNKRSILSGLVMLLLVTSFSCFTPATPAKAATPQPPPKIYNHCVLRYYKSSVDGAALPCQVYVPNKKWASPVKLPVWVDLHPFGNGGVIPPTSTSWAYQMGMIAIAPWGRNYYSFYTDGKQDPSRPAEPSIYDDFSNNADGWSSVIGDQWSAGPGVYEQSDMSDTWKEADRSDSSGSDYSASAVFRLLDSSSTDGNTETAAGIVVRRQASGDCYLTALDFTSDGKKWVRVYKCIGGKFITLNSAQLSSSFDVKKIHSLKVFLYEDNIRVFVDYLKRLEVSDHSFTSGGVGLASFGGKHRFDEVRILNETPYGEQDILDCVNQCLEELSIDPKIRPDCSKMFISGVCMGGIGAWNLGLHYPDMFGFIHPTCGTTDLAQGYNWIKTQYPDQDGTVYKVEQDFNVPPAVRALLHGREADSNDIEVRNTMHEYSARYILENALNTPVRIEHPEYDTLVPNTTNPMTIKWKTAGGKIVKVKDGAQRPSSSYAHSQGIWNTWASTPGLYNCVPETSLYDYNTGKPLSITAKRGIWNNYDYSKLPSYLYGAHVVTTMGQTGVMDDYIYTGKILRSFQRLNQTYGQLHTDPNDVAYKTYDNKHNKAWWLTMELAYPDQDMPGLARIHRDTAANTVNVHVKNVKTTALDVMSMKLDTSTSGKQLTLTVDANTAPESEFKVTDNYKMTNLKLVGQWYPAQKGDYQVTMDGIPVNFDMTGTALAIPNIDTTSTRTITITIPSGIENMLAGANPGFELGTTGWSLGSSIYGLFELNQEAFYAHTGSKSIRIKDPKATDSPYIASWRSDGVAVQAGGTYTLSAFAKTRSLNNQVRAYVNGKYDPSDYSSAKVRVMWLDASGNTVGESTSDGIRETNDWTPLEVTAVAPSGATQAKAVLLTECPNDQGIAGSVWFDDVALR